MINYLKDFFKSETVIILDRLDFLEKGYKEMNIILSLLTDQLSKTLNVQQEAVDTIKKLLSEKEQQASVQEKVKALTDNLMASTEALAASVASVNASVGVPSSPAPTNSEGDPNQPTA